MGYNLRFAVGCHPEVVPSDLSEVSVVSPRKRGYGAYCYVANPVPVLATVSGIKKSRFYAPLVRLCLEILFGAV
jgi:hypothetical protein